MRKGLILRPASSEDAYEAAFLFYSTGPAAFNLAFGSQDKAISIIRRLFAKPGNPMSFEHTTVAGLGRRVAGILNLSDLETLKRSQPRMGWQLFNICGPLFLLFRLPIYLRLESLAGIGSADELCIEYVAVAPDMRGKGIGRTLMQKAEVVARRRGYEFLSLYVLSDNLPAIGFYRKLGYRCEARRIDPWFARRYGFKGFLRMIRRIL
jgi:ribosomal protein S18 acetylase RimI-like enzyme